MKSSTLRNDRSGFTLLEMIVAMTVIAITLALTVPFFRNEVQAFSPLGKTTHSRTHATAYDDRPRAPCRGRGVVDPSHSFGAAPYAITFNVDLVSRINDKGAAYHVRHRRERVIRPKTTRSRFRYRPRSCSIPTRTTTSRLAR